MKKKWIGMIVLAALASATQAATVTWDDGAADDYWSSGANWSGTPDNTAPANGDSVVLTATAQSRLDYAWTIVTGATLTSTTSSFGDELDLEGTKEKGSVL